MVTPLTAAGAYANIARLAAKTGQESGLGGTSEPKNAGFGAALKEALDAVKDIGRKSDAETRAAVNGKANMVDVVTAVSETEVAIDAVVAVRDKVIAAYEEIMKMPI
jgi:flagellar hook-basal body complex protein FliE